MDINCNQIGKIGALNKSGVQSNKSPSELTRQEWAGILTPFQYAVLRESHTERAHSGQYAKHKERGGYHCAACGILLFDSEAKFESKCGWPSFSKATVESGNSNIVDSGQASTGDSNNQQQQQPLVDHTATTNVDRRTDTSYGLVRTEAICRGCKSHLGHVFDDGPRPTRERYCVNSAALEFVPK